jgi:undecaprenyl-diphosphatase
MAAAPPSYLEAVVLGVVQGLTEFLPISSTAHLRIVPPLFGWDDPGAAVSAVIQCGTLLAVFAALWPDIAGLAAGAVAGLRSGRPLDTVGGRVALMVGLGTLPIVIVGFACRHLIRGEARRLEVVTAALLAGTLVMAVAEIVAARRRAAGVGAAGRHGLEQVRLGDGVVMGLAQVFSLLPGMSRSGVTMSSGIFTGLDRATAARLSFILSLPAVGAAGLLEAWQEREVIFGSREAIVAAALGTASAAIVGYVAIRWLLALLSSRTLWPFVAYRLVVAAALVGVLVSGRAPRPAVAGRRPAVARPVQREAARSASPMPSRLSFL